MEVTRASRGWNKTKFAGRIIAYASDGTFGTFRIMDVKDCRVYGDIEKLDGILITQGIGQQTPGTFEYAYASRETCVLPTDHLDVTSLFGKRGFGKCDGSYTTWVTNSLITFNDLKEATFDDLFPPTNPASAFDTAEKETVNNMFAKHAASIAPDSKALILDSELGTSCKTLMRYGFQEKNIFVPNFTEACCDTLREKFPEAHISQKSLNDFLRLQSRKGLQFGTVFLDFCCTVDGNNGNDLNPAVKPLLDAEILFQRKWLSDRAVIGYTFCSRNINHIPGQPDEIRALNEFRAIAAKYGYTLQTLDSYKYRTMYFELICVVKEVKRPRSNKRKTCS